MPPKSVISPSRVQSGTKAARARRLLTRGQLLREDSDDELGFEDHPWQWVYDENESLAAGRNSTRADGEVDNASLPTSKRRPKPRQLSSRSCNQEIIGAKMGSFECRIGDCLLLKAEGEGNKAWVGIICEFGEDENDEMSANVMCGYRWSRLRPHAYKV
jgi:origin recognition complex subunit 1